MELGLKAQSPRNHHLSNIIDNYFYLDVDINVLKETHEYVLPFPRITFGYFFDSPFLVTNHDLNTSIKVNMVISRISNQKISVLPLSNRIRVLGAHAKPYALALLTDYSISKLPWLIDTTELFGSVAQIFRKRIDSCVDPQDMFDQVEKVFLNTLLERDLSTIINSVELIESSKGDIRINDIANQFEISTRGLRDQFHKHIGCAPKEFIQLVRLKNSIFQMHKTNSSLTNITYDSNFFDQAHFINTFKKITGKSPMALKRELANFRFLQF